VKLPLWFCDPIGRRTKSRKRSLPGPKGGRARLILEPLGERVVLANLFWNGDANGPLDVASN
jgi:hypothetical protein